MLILTFFMIRLVVLVDYSVKDYKKTQLFTSDFTVYVPSIPLNPEYYNYDHFLLKAMITKYMEEFLINKFSKNNT